MLSQARWRWFWIAIPNLYGTHAANRLTGSALDAYSAVQLVRDILTTVNGLGWTNTDTCATTGAILGIDNMTNERLTNTGGASALKDVGQEFLAEILESGKHRIRGALSQAAQ